MPETADDLYIRTTCADFDRPVIPDFTRLPTEFVSDAAGRMGSCDAGIRPLVAGLSCFGSAFPVTLRAGDNAGIHASIEFLQPGDVLIVDGGGDRSRAVCGGNLAARLVQLGVRGLIVDGCVRDHGEIRATGLPVWARGVVPAGPFRLGPAVVGEPASVGGVAVSAGDSVIADDDGVVIVPAYLADEVCVEARRAWQAEQDDAGRPTPQPARRST